MPGRKVEASLLGLVDSEMEDSSPLSDDDVLQSPEATTCSNAKKAPSTTAKPKAKANKVTKAKAPARKRATKAATTGEKPAGRKASRPKRKALEENVNEQELEEVQDDGLAGREIHDSIEVLGIESEDQQDVAEEIQMKENKKAGKKSNPANNVTQDGEFEYTPTVMRQSKLESNGKGRSKKVVAVAKGKQSTAPSNSRANATVIKVDTMEVDESYISAVETGPEARTSKPTATAASHARAESRQGQTAPARRRAGSASDTERTSSDPALRRKLGDMTKKFENVDLKYRNLREVGITEANMNMEKLKKQCDEATSGMC
jgi:hypothetical protein